MQAPSLPLSAPLDQRLDQFLYDFKDADIAIIRLITGWIENKRVPAAFAPVSLVYNFALGEQGLREGRYRDRNPEYCLIEGWTKIEAEYGLLRRAASLVRPSIFDMLADELEEKWVLQQLEIASMRILEHDWRRPMIIRLEEPYENSRIHRHPTLQHTYGNPYIPH